MENVNAVAVSSARFSRMSLLFGWSSHGKPINSNHHSVLQFVLSGSRVGELRPLTPPEVKPTHPTSTSRGSQSCFGLLILFGFSDKHPLSKLMARTRPLATRLSVSPRVLPSAPRRYREVMSPENVGIQARMVSSFASLIPSVLSSCIRTGRLCLSIDPFDFCSPTAHNPRMVSASGGDLAAVSLGANVDGSMSLLCSKVPPVKLNQIFLRISLQSWRLILRWTHETDV